MKRIKKMYQGAVPANLILNGYSTSQTDTYSCNYINSQLSAHPIGSIYMSDNSTSPALLFGGTWERLNGYYPYFGNGYNKTTYTGKNTQGHTLTANQSGLRNHNHDSRIQWKDVQSASPCYQNWNDYNNITVDAHLGNDGLTGNWDAIDAHSHNIATVELYAWRRTA